eukprot:CAMPEP_0168282718 /NCGR_PEP_ID=MMETSP0141_2-20121125/22506_1 /TAXON_ID=44445 /ORGANISM="Pseudo-nitzschia australis, Strain 10249 10 AB" /LENGTH=277 /DNA_ID=CAMNT_0008226441 /DNA_START=182 /DNA_END=1012 /DNA_ORIENTATION=+
MSSSLSSTTTPATPITTDSSMLNHIDLEASLGRIEDLTANERKRKCQAEQYARSSPSLSHSYSSREEHQHRIEPQGITRTSSSTPFRSEAAASSDSNTSTKANRSDSLNSLLPQPYPISETIDEIKERRRLTASVDWSNGLAIANATTAAAAAAAAAATETADQQSMMEVTVDDFVLSAEEASTLTGLDATTITENPNGFWDTPVHVATTLSMDRGDTTVNACSVPFSVTFPTSFLGQYEDLDGPDPYAMNVESENAILITDADADASPIRSVDMEW